MPTQPFTPSTDRDAPGRVEPNPGSAGAAARETSDPNFTAASQPASARAAGASMNPDTPPVDTPRRRGRSTHVRDVMSANIEVAAPDTSLYYVARMMAERDIGAIPIVDSTDGMRPLGILTDRDIVVRVLAKNQNPDELRAGQVMTPTVVTARPDTPIPECLRLMEQHQVRRILVTDERNRVVGIVAQADIATNLPGGETADLVTEVSKPQHRE
jgi:CBS domain-containing protein